MWIHVFFMGFFIAAVLAVASAFTTRFAFICKVRTKRNAVLAWAAVAALCAMAVAFTAPKDQDGNVIIPEPTRQGRP